MKVGRYEVTGSIGRGASGVVYKARAPSGETVALKFLAAVPGSESRARFERERKLLAELGDSRGFVPLLDSGESPQGPWFAMPFLEGGTLRERLRGEPWTPADVVALGRALAKALAEAHARGIVHRDLKPENVLFDASGRPLIADLGIAKHVDANGVSTLGISRSGAFRGTAGYMAPEQMHDAKSAGPAADVFALGAILHEALVGRPPYVGETAIEILARVEAGEREPLPRTVPGWLRAVVDRALARDPARRYGDAAELLAALEGARPRRRRLLLVPLLLVALVGGWLAWQARLASRAREHLARGLQHLEAGRLDDAWRDFEAAIALDPALARAWSGRGRVRLERGDREGAIADCNRAIALDATRPAPWANRGTARLERGDREGLRDIDRAIGLDPTFAPAFFVRAIERAKAGELDGALADFSRVIELAPRDSGAWRSRANVHNMRGDFEAGCRDATRAIELDPRDATAWTERGIAHGHRSEREAARADLDRALDLDPGHVEALVTRGALRSEVGDAAGALEDYGRAIALDPREARARRNRAILLGQRGDLDAALADLDRAIEVAREPETFFVRAWVRDNKGDRTGALADYDRAIELDPRNATYRLNRGAIRATLGDRESAVLDYSAAIELDPRNARALNNRGFEREAKGRREDAEKDYDRAIEVAPDYASPRYNRAVLLEKKGDRAGARRDFENYLSLIGDAPAAEDEGRVKYARERVAALK